jgi:hypothetical protein
MGAGGVAAASFFQYNKPPASLIPALTAAPKRLI